MRCLIDYHHSDLAESLHRLFEDRLGLTVYVPHGMDWFTEGYWRFGAQHFGDALARQYLEGPLGGFHPRQLRPLTLAQFRDLDSWAVICATVQENQAGYHRLAQEVGARYLYQVGNTGQWIDYTLEPFIFGAAGITAHQEIDLDDTFRFSPYVGPMERVASFVNLFAKLPCYPLMEAVRQELPGWTFDVYGHEGEQGFVKPTAAVARAMRTYAWAWHDKVTGDGFGHVIHQWAAIGRPLIGHAHHYAGQQAADLWEDGITCIDLDRHSTGEAARLLVQISDDPARYHSMCRAIRERVEDRVNYPAEAEAVGQALGLVAV